MIYPFQNLSRERNLAKGTKVCKKEQQTGNGNKNEIWQWEREQKELKDKRKEQNRPAQEQAGTKIATKPEQTLVQCKE
jgi:hypothetical protein